MLFRSGLQRSFPTEIYVGLFLVIVLALVCDLVLVAIKRVLTPWAPRPERRQRQRRLRQLTEVTP